jgi:chromate reductase
MEATCRILLISGSLRAGSTNTALLRSAQAAAPDGVHAQLYDGLGALPHFNPDDDAEGAVLHPAVEDLRQRLGEADALLFSTPEYAGGLPGSFKNLLDWTVGGGETYGMPVAWLNASGPAAPSGARDAHDSLRKVLGYTGCEIVEAACLHIPVVRADVGPDGKIADSTIGARAAAALQALAAHVLSRSAARS